MNNFCCIECKFSCEVILQERVGNFVANSNFCSEGNLVEDY